jgi:hypothetical protein
LLIKMRFLNPAEFFNPFLKRSGLNDFHISSTKLIL